VHFCVIFDVHTHSTPYIAHSGVDIQGHVRMVCTHHMPGEYTTFLYLISELFRSVRKACSSIHSGQLILKIISKIGATRCQILRIKCTKFDYRWSSAPDPLRSLQRFFRPARGLLLRGERWKGKERRKRGRKEGREGREGKRGGERPYAPLSQIPGYAIDSAHRAVC